jgi:hypothetical protein
MASTTKGGTLRYNAAEFLSFKLAMRFDEAAISRQGTTEAIKAAKALWKQGRDYNKIVTADAVESHMRLRLDKTQALVDGLRVAAQAVIDKRNS